MGSVRTGRRIITLVALAFVVAACAAQPEGNQRVVAEDLTIPGGDPGIQLYVRNKKDSRESWVAGKPYYDPAKIAVPVLITLGEWDNDTPPYMAQTLFPLLVNAPSKRMVMVGEATHTMVMERNRLQLFGAVQAFLDEK
ncbi:MAG: hypothetical protein EXR02_07065 [Rhodospirillales bacterium]|nr:hypothetical protein [Rhodospirillales bacterium]MSP80811.1 hypothetical protein [Rhodospirillales bacterium]